MGGVEVGEVTCGEDVDQPRNGKRDAAVKRG